VKALKPEYFELQDAADFADINNRITIENADKREDLMTVVDFELETAP
jgi:hypothetical protein